MKQNSILVKEQSEMLITLKEACNLLNCHPNTLRRWDKSGLLLAIRFGTRGDRRYKTADILKLLDKKNKNPNSDPQKSILPKVKTFLKKNAAEIQKNATDQHKIFLSKQKLRSENINQYQKNHLQIINLIADSLESLDSKLLKENINKFKTLGKKLAQESVADKLTIEEATDGLIYLKQAILKKLKTENLLNQLTLDEIYNLTQMIGAYSDTIMSQLAFSFHENIIRKLEIQKEHEKTIREAKKYAEEIINSSEDAIISIDIKGIIRSWNQGAINLYGYKPEEIIGKPISIIIPPDKKNDFPKIIREFKKGNKIEHYETQRITKDRKIIDISLSVAPLKNDRGVVVGASKIARDISDKKRMENYLYFLSEASELLSSSLDYKTTLANIAKIAVPHIADWCSVNILENDQIQELVIVHKDPQKIRFIRDMRKIYPRSLSNDAGVSYVIRTGKTQFYPKITDAMLKKAASNQKHFKMLKQIGLTSAMLIPLCSGKNCIGAISFINSESQRIFTKEELSLSQEVAKRASLAIENAKLYTEAQKAISVRDEFISVVSHELKTPVTSLKLYEQILKQEFIKKGDQTLLVYFNKMDEQIDKFNMLISDLLNVSKIQHGKMEFHMEYFDLNDAVNEVRNSLQSIAKKHEIIIDGKINKKVYGDKYRIDQVLSNLLTNAVKYSPKGKQVIIHLASRKNAATVCIEDFGIGIDETHQRRIFEQFYRVTSPEEKTYPGLGMGLYISNEIIKRHGSNINVISRKGKGSKFSFTLPFVKV